MDMIVKMKKLLRMSVLLLIAISVILLTGCGKEGTPPPGTALTITQLGDPIITNLTITASATKTQQYRVSAAGADSIPLSGINVDLFGQFTNGVVIDFGGATGSAPTTLSAAQKTDDFGFFTFEITAPYFNQGPQIHVPYNQTATGSATGGTLAGGTYFYTVTALDFQGETEATMPFSAIVSAPTTSLVGSVTVSWQAVPGATSYNIYGRTAGSIGLMITILNPTGDPLTWVDTGSATPSGTSPPTKNTTGLSLNSIKGSFFATAGSAISATTTVDF
jgi:hypothetical protein